MSGTKSTLDGINNRLGTAKEVISELEDTEIQTRQIKQKKKKQKKQSTDELQENVKELICI